MSLKIKSLRPQLTRQNIEDRQRAAMSIDAKWRKMCTPYMRHYMECQSEALQVPIDFLFTPILTSVASMMGTSTRVRINRMWTEPMILWTFPVAAKGEGKSTALGVIKNAVKQVDSERVETEMGNWRKDQANSQTEVAEGMHPVQSQVVEQFTFEALQEVMMSNDGEAIGMYDEATSFFELVEHNKQGSIDRKTLLSLNGGASWCRTTKSGGTKSLHSTKFNLTGFLQPAYAIHLLNADDYDGYKDRLWFVCPKPKDGLFHDLVQGIDSMPPELDDALSHILRSIRETHATVGDMVISYEMSEAAQIAYASFFDKMIGAKRDTDDDDHKGIYSKARGQVARIAGILKATDVAFTQYYNDQDIKIQGFEEEAFHNKQQAQGVKLIEESQDGSDSEAEHESVLGRDDKEESNESAEPGEETEANADTRIIVINEAIMGQAIETMEYLLQHKISLMPPEYKKPTTTTQTLGGGDIEGGLEKQNHVTMSQKDIYVEGIFDRFSHNLKSLVNHGLRIYPAYIVAGRHLMPAGSRPNPYTTAGAVTWLEAVAAAGFGTIEKGKRGGSISFHKHKFMSLSPVLKAKLLSLSISEEQYDAFEMERQQPNAKKARTD